MSFQVQSDNLRSQAGVWADRRDAVRTVRTSIEPCFGRGSAFGLLAGGAGVESMFNEWTSDMDNALHDAELSFSYLESSLISTADGYDDSDATTVSSMSRLDDLIDPASYRHD